MRFSLIRNGRSRERQENEKKLGSLSHPSAAKLSSVVASPPLVSRQHPSAHAFSPRETEDVA